MLKFWFKRGGQRRRCKTFANTELPFLKQRKDTNYVKKLTLLAFFNILVETPSKVCGELDSGSKVYLDIS